MEMYAIPLASKGVPPDSNRGLYLELDLAPTGIMGLEDRVGIPSFNSPFCEADYRGNQSSHFKAHYASKVALQRLYVDLHNNINDYCKDSTSLNFPISISKDYLSLFLTTNLQLKTTTLTHSVHLTVATVDPKQVL
jgi:hypothetical protein